MTVAIVFDRLGPYHVARLTAAADRCTVVAIELASETNEYAWSKVATSTACKRVTLFPNRQSREVSAIELQSRMSGALETAQPDVVAIPGWSNKGAFAALHWSAENRVPAILMSESTLNDEPRRWWKEWVKRRIVGLYSTALVGGRLHADYLEQLGMARDRIFTGYDVVDNDHFAQPPAALDSESSTLNFPDNYFLASARFIPKKNLRTLLNAFAEYRRGAGVNAWKLVLLGDGPLRHVLLSQLSSLGLTDSVLMPGFKQYDELPAYYARAGAFVHPSITEQWGLVVNEAVAAGLPVIISNRCGCVPELVSEGQNGFTFDPRNEDELSVLLTKTASLSPQERNQMGTASRGLAARQTPMHFGEGIQRAAQLATSSPPHRTNAFDTFLLERLLSQ